MLNKLGACSRTGHDNVWNGPFNPIWSGGIRPPPLDVLFHNFFNNRNFFMKPLCKFVKFNSKHDRRLVFQNRPIGSVWGGVRANRFRNFRRFLAYFRTDNLLLWSHLSIDSQNYFCIVCKMVIPLRWYRFYDSTMLETRDMTSFHDFRRISCDILVFAML